MRPAQLPAPKPSNSSETSWIESGTFGESGWSMPNPAAASRDLSSVSSSGFGGLWGGCDGVAGSCSAVGEAYMLSLGPTVAGIWPSRAGETDGAEEATSQVEAAWADMA